MTVIELRQFLEAGGALYGHDFTLGGLGADVPGIELRDGVYYTYRAVTTAGRARKTGYVKHASEPAACAALCEAAVEQAEAAGRWTG